MEASVIYKGFQIHRHGAGYKARRGVKGHPRSVVLAAATEAALLAAIDGVPA